MTSGAELAGKRHVADGGLVQRRRGQIVAAAVELFSEQGFYRTTIQDVARKAGVSIGLIYQYVRDKDDILLLALLSVLDTYKHQIPEALVGLSDALERCWAAVEGYCRVIDSCRRETVLAYRSTKSLPKEWRTFIERAEIDTNEIIAACLRDCVRDGLFRDINIDLVAYYFVTFAHAWALKHWLMRKLCSLDQYIDQGIDFHFSALLTAKGQRQYKRMQAGRARKDAGATRIA